VTRKQPRWVRTFCQWLCALPDGLDTLEGFSRTHHQDLLGMDRVALRRERDRVRLRLVLEDEPDQWFVERLAAVDGVIRASR